MIHNPAERHAHKLIVSSIMEKTTHTIRKNEQ